MRFTRSLCRHIVLTAVGAAMLFALAPTAGAIPDNELPEPIDESPEVLILSPASYEFKLRGSLSLQASGFDFKGNPLPVTWTARKAYIGDPGCFAAPGGPEIALAPNEDGLGLDHGIYTVMATVTDSSGRTATDSVECVKLGMKPEIVQPSAGRVYYLPDEFGWGGDTITLEVKTLDANNAPSVLPNSSVGWQFYASDGTFHGRSGYRANILASELGLGWHTIYFWTTAPVEKTEFVEVVVLPSWCRDAFCLVP